MDKIKWCIQQKSGICVIETNDNLCQEYFKKAYNALKATKALENNEEWQISSAYYSMYFSLYALLMKIGVKCEIHTCTIEIAKRYFNHFNENDISLLNSSLSARINAQYYTDRDVAEEQRKEMVDAAPRFYLKCKDISVKLTNKEILAIREKIRT